MREMVHFLDSRSMELVILEGFLPFVVCYRCRSMREDRVRQRRFNMDDGLCHGFIIGA